MSVLRWQRKWAGYYELVSDTGEVWARVNDTGHARTQKYWKGGKYHVNRLERWQALTASGASIGYGKPTLAEIKARVEEHFDATT